MSSEGSSPGHSRDTPQGPQGHQCPPNRCSSLHAHKAECLPTRKSASLSPCWKTLSEPVERTSLTTTSAYWERFPSPSFRQPSGRLPQESTQSSLMASLAETLSKQLSTQTSISLLGWNPKSSAKRHPSP